MDTLLQFITDLWGFVVTFCQIPFGTFIANFLISLLSAYLTIKFLLMPDPDLKKSLLRMQAMWKDKTLSQLSKQYIRQYSLYTGFLSAVLVISQFKDVHLFMATVCGIAGPYTLRNVITKSFFSGQFRRLVVNQTLKANKPLEAYEDDLTTVKKKLKYVDNL